MLRNLRVAGYVVTMHDIGAVAEKESVIVQFIDVLDVIRADVISGDQIVDQVGVEGIDGLLLGKAICMPWAIICFQKSVTCALA